MKFVMVGSGAVGGYFGAKLQQAGHTVVFIARGETLRGLNSRGLLIQLEHGELRLPKVTATDAVEAVGAADYVFISVKTWQLADLLPKLEGLKGNSTRFLTLQNGVEAPHEVAAALGIEYTLGGLVRGFFELLGPGHVQHVGVRPAIIFGPLLGQAGPEEEHLLRCLTESDIYAELSPDIEAALWAKFLLVTALGGVGAVTRSSVGEFRDYPPTWEMLQQVMREIALVGRAHGVRLAENIIETTAAFMHTFPAEATTSMQRDIMQGRPSELEAQLGAVVRLGTTLSVATPLCQFIYDSLILQERRSRAPQ